MGFYTTFFYCNFENLFLEFKTATYLHSNVNIVQLKRGIRQRNSSLSPKLFTLVLEDVFKKKDWSQKATL